MLSFDVSQLVIRYTIESYKLPKWIDKSFHPEIFKIYGIGENHRAAKYIMKNLPEFPIERIGSNPHPKIIEHIKSYVETHGLNKHSMLHIMRNPSTDPDFIAWVDDKISNFMDEQARILSHDEFNELLMSSTHSNKSKKFFDKYLASDDNYSSRVFLNFYPYFPNESNETNTQYFISMLNKFYELPFCIGEIPAPLIIKKLEIIYGLAPPDSIPDQVISEKLSTLMRNMEPANISQNPGAIHILKAKPKLINALSLSHNPRVGEIIECGLLRVNLLRLLTYRTDDSKVFDIIKKSIVKPIRDIAQIKYIDVWNQYLFESYDNMRLIRLVLTHLVC